MENILLTLFLTISTATVLNIVLKRFGISHIIGYIVTGTIITAPAVWVEEMIITKDNKIQIIFFILGLF